MCKSRATHRAFITRNMSRATWFEGTGHLLGFTGMKSHLYCSFISFAEPLADKRGGKPKYPEKTLDLQKCHDNVSQSGGVSLSLGPQGGQFQRFEQLHQLRGSSYGYFHIPQRVDLICSCQFRYGWYSTYPKLKTTVAIVTPKNLKMGQIWAKHNWSWTLWKEKYHSLAGQRAR